MPRYKDRKRFRYRSVERSVDIFSKILPSILHDCSNTRLSTIVQLSDLSLKNIKAWNIYWTFPAGIYLLKVNNRNTRTKCEICWKLTIKAPERRRSGAFIVSFEHISQLVVVFLLLILNMKMLAGMLIKSKAAPWTFFYPMSFLTLPWKYSVFFFSIEHWFAYRKF